MRIFRKQTQRKPVTTVLLALLLALSACASSIGFTAWAGAREQLQSLEESFTTIAIPKEQDTDRFEFGGTIYEDGSIEWGDGQWYYPPNVVEKASAQLSQVVSIDRRCLLGAQVKGIPSLTSGRMDILQYHQALDDYSYNLSVLAVKCLSCDVMVSPGSRDESGTTWGNISYIVDFEILDEVCQNDAYESRVGEPITYGCILVNRDGSAPFEVGKTYLIRGFYEDYPILELIDDSKTSVEAGYQFYYEQYDPDAEAHKQHLGGLIMNALPENLTFYTRPGSEDTGLTHFREEGLESEDLMRNWVTPEDSLPFFAEYTGTWQDFLNTPEGQVWRDEVIPMCQTNYESATVMLTDDLQSLYSFNVGDASLLEGEGFTRGQLQNGDPVCLISAAYAQANGLQVGQPLTLDFYNSGYATETSRIQGTFGVTEVTTISRYPLIPETRIGFQQEYTIIGIYTAPEFSFGTHSFHADTIFVPKASVPNAEQYEDPATPILNTLILKNGASAQFEAAIRELGYGGYYLYFDQNYGETAEALHALNANAQRLMLVGMILFVLASLVFLLLYARRIDGVARAMRLLGISRRRVGLELTVNLLGLELMAVVLGTVLSAGIFDWVTARLLSDSLTMSLREALLCAVVQYGLLILAGGLWMVGMAGRNPMRGMAKGKWQWKKRKAAAPS